jgi:hypothetical protein
MRGRGEQKNTCRQTKKERFFVHREREKEISKLLDFIH